MDVELAEAIEIELNSLKEENKTLKGSEVLLD
jgi:hypothetical protein